MASIGDVKYAFGRSYIYAQPDPSLGPGTWRVATVDSDSNSSNEYLFNGDKPVVVTTVLPTPGNSGVVTTNLDFAVLESRTA